MHSVATSLRAKARFTLGAVALYSLVACGGGGGGGSGNGGDGVGEQPQVPAQVPAESDHLTLVKGNYFGAVQEVLASEAYRTAKYKVVMVHQSVFGLGDNATPVMAQTQASFEYVDAAGAVRVLGPLPFPIDPATWNGQIQPIIDAGRMRFVKYDYPLSGDLWRNDIEPMLVGAGVQLVHVGHSHLWCRSKVGTMNYIETSNVGNTYGAFVDNLPPRRSAVPAPTALTSVTGVTWNQDDYPREGDPHDRVMFTPTLRQPMVELAGATNAVPFVASNDITAYSILDTGAGTISSYAFDTRYPARDPIKFDEFSLI